MLFKPIPSFMNFKCFAHQLSCRSLSGSCVTLSQLAPIWSKFLPSKTLRERAKKKNLPAVAVVNLHGIIAAQAGGGFTPGGRKPINLNTTRKIIKDAFETKKLEAVLLSINSPGGSAVQSELVTEYIMNKGKEKSVPIYSFVEDVAASGGYWLACAGDKIFVSSSSVVGSIGVISASFGLHDSISKLGIERRILTAGKNKSFMDPFRPLEEKDILIVKNILNAIHDNFKSHVATSRGSRLNSDREKVFSGEVWVGKQAVELGLADDVQSIDTFVRSKFGSEDNVRTVFVKSTGNKLQELLGTATFASQSASLSHLNLLQRLDVLEQALLYDSSSIFGK